MTFFEQKNYDKILEMSHPGLVERFDKKMLIDAFKMIFEGNDEFSVKLNSVPAKDFEVSEIFESGNSKFAFVSFPMNMEMKFKNHKLDSESQKMMVNMMEVQGMNAKFVDESTVQITKLALTLALKDKSTNNEWRYLNHDESNPLYTTIVPIEIVKQAKSYYSELLIKQKENAN